MHVVLDVVMQALRQLDPEGCSPQVPQTPLKTILKPRISYASAEIPREILKSVVKSLKSDVKS